MTGQPEAHLVQPVLAEAGRADHHVQVVFGAPAQVLHDHAGVGEVDHHVAPGQRVERVALVDLGGHLQVRRLGDGADHLAPHPTPRPEHTYLSHRRLPLARLTVDRCSRERGGCQM